MIPITSLAKPAQTGQETIQNTRKFVKHRNSALIGSLAAGDFVRKGEDNRSFTDGIGQCVVENGFTFDVGEPTGFIVVPGHDAMLS